MTPTCSIFIVPVTSFAAPAAGRPTVSAAAAPPAVCRKSRRPCFVVSSGSMVHPPDRLSSCPPNLKSAKTTSDSSQHPPVEPMNEEARVISAASEAQATTTDVAAYRAVELIYHSYLTGLILMLSSRAGAAPAAEVVFRTFRRQQLARFLPGLKKLGLDKLPHAVACAQYHYLSNQVGGVKVEYVYENDRKAWVRYPPPRWIWWGTAICGIPSDVSRAMLRGWHANNGVVLNNPRLGFVCTGQTVDGAPGLEGYYREFDHDLAPEERLQFSPDERCPPFRPELAPRLPETGWPEARLRKVLRNYAME